MRLESSAANRRASKQEIHDIQTVASSWTTTGVMRRLWNDRVSCCRATGVALAVAGSLVWFPAAAVAQCESRADATPVDYLEYREGRFTIC